MPSRPVTFAVGVILFLTGLAAVLAFRSQVRELIGAVLGWIGSLGVWGPVLFILVYIVASVLFVPASLLTLGAGALFGIVRGSCYAIVGATLGATAAFLVARYLARDWVSHRIEASEKFAAIDEAVAREGGKIVLLTRLSPIFPFNLLNYAFGLTKVGLSSYILASAFGMLPATLLYVYLGAVAGTVASAANRRNRTPTEWALLGVGLMATIAVTVVITRVARQALREKISA